MQDLYKVLFSFFFLILISFTIPITFAASPYQCVTQGLFEQVFDGSNVTGSIMAEDFLIHNGSSCCGEVGGGGTTYTGGANISLAGNVISLNASCIDITGSAALCDGNDASASSVSKTGNFPLYNLSDDMYLNMTAMNETTNASIDLRVNLAFLQNLLDTIYTLISNKAAGWDNSSGTTTNTDLNVNISKGNVTVDTDLFFIDSTNNRVAIGQKSGFDPRKGLSITGDLDINHSATENDDHAMEIDVNVGGFGDIKAIDVVYTTGIISAGENEEVILINIDESLSTGGGIIGVSILTTEGSAKVYGLEAGVLVNPIVQLSGTFGNMDSINNSGVDDLGNFTSTTSDISIFVSDNDEVIIGDTSKFEEIEFLLNTTSSGAGIKPVFNYSTGLNTWGTFSPTDGTNGMRNTGIIAWFDDDIPTWATGTGGEYLIKIIRTANSLSTVPIENKVQISAVTVYNWNSTGDLNINKINAADYTDVSITESQITDLSHIGNCSGRNCNIGWGNLTSVPPDIADGDDTGTGSENCSGRNCDLGWGNLTSVPSDIADGDDDTNINNCSISNSCGGITYDSELAYIGNCSGRDCNLGCGNFTGGDDLDFCSDADTTNTSRGMQKAVNQTGYFYDITVSDLFCTNCLTGTEITELTDADISNTLTCSDVVAGSSVIADAEVDNDITIASTKDMNTTGNFNVNLKFNVTAVNGNVDMAGNLTVGGAFIYYNGTHLIFT